MKEFCDWLYGTPLSHLIKTVVWIIPTLQTIHIICLAVLFTSMAMLDFRLLGVAGTRRSVHSVSQRFLPALWGALPIMLLTGLLLIIAEPSRDLQNAAFYLKMSLIIIVSLITLGFQRSVNRDPGRWDQSSEYRQRGKVIGVVSLLIWVTIVISGRLIAYV